MSLDSCWKKFLRAQKEADLAPHPVVSVVLQAGDAEKFPEAHGFESLDPFSESARQGPCLRATEESEGDTRLGQLACKAGHLSSPDPV